MKKVLVFGTFDSIHPGHEYFFNEAKKHGDHLTVIISRDKTVVEVKKHTPKYNEIERKKSVESLGIADIVLLGNEGDKLEIIDFVKPDIIALGYDQKFFTDILFEKHSKVIKIVRLKPFEESKYKSSKINKKIE